MLTIGIDGRFAVRQRRGIGNYSANLLRHLARIDETNRYIIYVDREDEENVLPRGGNFTVKKLFPKDYAFWEQIILPLQAALDRVDLLHCIGNTAPRFLHPRIKLISTIHDAIFFRGEDLFPISTDPLQRRMRRYRQNNIRRSASRLSRVITVSHHSKEALLSYLPSLRPEMISVIPLAPKEEFCPVPHEAAAPSFPEGYVFAVGCREPRKNTMRIIEAFLELKAEKAIPESLVIAGVSDWRKSAFFKRVAVSPHANSVFFTDYLSESELRAHYRGAKIFLYPSLYEGFGFPPLEAMACGTPVITSDTTSIPEVVGDAAVRIEPTDVNALKQAIFELLRDPGKRERLSLLGNEQVKMYSWERTARETLEVYLKVAGEKSG